MSWTYISKSPSQAQAAGAFTYLKPASIADGDLLVVVEISDGIGGGFSLDWTGKGYTQGDDTFIASAPLLSLKTYAKIASSETDYAMNDGGGVTFWMAVILAYRWSEGNPGITGLNVFGRDDSETAAAVSPALIELTSYNPTDDDALGIYVAGAKGSAADVSFTLDGLTSRHNAQYNDGNLAIAVGDHASVDPLPAETFEATFASGTCSVAGGLLVADRAAAHIAPVSETIMFPKRHLTVKELPYDLRDTMRGIDLRGLEQ